MNRGFLLRSGQPKACLLLHGLASSPWELSDLGRFLHQNGWTVLAPLLTDLKDHEQDGFSRLSPETWLAPARQSLARLLDEGLPTTVIGTSLGGVVAAILAAEEPRITCLVLANPPFLYRHPLLRALILWPLPLKGLPAKIPEEAEEEYFPYFPFKALRVLHAMARQALRTAGEVRQPLLLLSSAKDRSVHPAGLRRFLRRAASIPKTLHILPDAPHSPFAPHYKGNRRVFELVLPFLLDRCLPHDAPNRRWGRIPAESQKT